MTSYDTVSREEEGRQDGCRVTSEAGKAHARIGRCKLGARKDRKGRYGGLHVPICKADPS
jgi:hypothetical protein